MYCVRRVIERRRFAQRPGHGSAELLAIMAFGLCCNACVDITKPASISACAQAGNCTDDINKDAASTTERDAAVPDTRPLGSPDATPPPPEAPGADQSVVPSDGARDAGGPEPGGERGPETPFVVGPEPQQGAEVSNEPGAEPAAESGRELAPELVADSGPEPAVEPGVEARPEPGAESGPEPGPEAGPEAPRDAGTVGTCPSGAICDDFQDGNYTANPVWTTPGGFAVSTDGSKVLAYTGTDTPAVAFVGGQVTNLTITAKVKATAFGGNSNSYRVGVFARANSQGTPSAWYALTITGDGSLRLQATDSTPSGCNAVTGAAVVGTWYILTMTVGGTVASTTLQGTLTDAAGGNAKTIGPCTIANGLAAGWAGLGVRGGGTQGEWDDVRITGITP